MASSVTGLEAVQPSGSPPPSRPVVVLCPHEVAYDQVCEYLASFCDRADSVFCSIPILVVSIVFSGSVEDTARLLSSYTQVVSLMSGNSQEETAAQWLLRAERSLVNFGSLRSVDVLCSAFLI